MKKINIISLLIVLLVSCSTRGTIKNNNLDEVGDVKVMKGKLGLANENGGWITFIPHGGKPMQVYLLTPNTFAPLLSKHYENEYSIVNTKVKSGNKVKVKIKLYYYVYKSENETKYHTFWKVIEIN